MLALLAQAAQPMFTHERVKTTARLRRLGIRDVTFRTSCAVWTVARLEGFAYWPVGRQADLVRLSKEWRESEVVGRGRVVEDGGGRRFDGAGHDV